MMSLECAGNMASVVFPDAHETKFVPFRVEIKKIS